MNQQNKKSLNPQVRFEKMDEDSKVKECYEGLRTLRNIAKKWAKENSLDLFKKKKMSDEVIDTIFNDFSKLKRIKILVKNPKLSFILDLVSTRY